MDGLAAPLALDERQLRVDLAAAFRLTARLGWQEAVANHFSVATSADGRRFLMNPRWRSFARLRASDLLALDAAGNDLATLPPLDLTAWSIHGALHAGVPHASCVMHLHPPYATALSCLADPTLLPVDQTTARFFNRIAIDLHYGGVADTAEEGARLAAVLGDAKVLMMGNHGVLTVAATIAEAYDAMVHLEQGCRTLMLAYATGRPLSVLSDAVAEKTARAWEDAGAFAGAHFSEMKRLLDAEDPSYAD